jgi:ABC-type sugar transport system ATPase subunit
VIVIKVLLLDEPLSNLDDHLREEMRKLILHLQRQREITTVFATHDQEEATVLADQIALFFEGVLQQVDKPYVFFEQPANLQVARFFGARNFIQDVANSNAIERPSGNSRYKTGSTYKEQSVSSSGQRIFRLYRSRTLRVI